MQNCHCVFCSHRRKQCMTAKVSRTVQEIQHSSRLLCFTRLTQECNEFLVKNCTSPSPQHSVIQMVTKHYKQRCVHYCAFLLNLLEDNPGLVNKLTVSDEAYFHLTVTVRRNEFCYWSTENPCELYQWPVHRRKVTMLYAVSLFRTSYTSLKTAG